jgi:serine/threonine-protein phosphatase 5
MESMKENKFIHKKYLAQIIEKAKSIFATQPTLVDIEIPEDVEFNVCGDVHGQYYDLLNIFKINGYPSKTNPYLFNGDFVDRGSFSVEVIITLLCWKILYPNHFFMARGNHESRNLNKLYGFEGEVKAKYDETIYECFCELFCYLPLAHVLNKEVIVVHGGIFSQDGVKLDDIRAVDRFRETPEKGLMCEILWSDPCKMPGRHPSKRGVGLSFGPDIAKKFLDDNKLSNKLII